MTEYLDAAKNYTLVKDTAKRSEDWIEVPQGAIAMTKRGSFYKNKDGFLFFKGFNKGDWRLSVYTKISQINNLVWQRESLNDKVASAEVVRQEVFKPECFEPTDNVNNPPHYAGNGVNVILQQRQSQYGDFRDVAETTRRLLGALKDAESYENLSHSQLEAMHMICSKLARIVNGDVDYVDNWVDIAGYSQLIVNQLNKEAS